MNQLINGHSSEMLTPDREQVSTQNNLENKKGKITKEWTDGRTELSIQLELSPFLTGKTHAHFIQKYSNNHTHQMLSTKRNKQNQSPKYQKKQMLFTNQIGRAPIMLQPWL